jgi:hypothetical protein
LREIGISREETVTRMNGVNLRLPCNPQNVVDISAAARITRIAISERLAISRDLIVVHDRQGLVCGRNALANPGIAMWTAVRADL